jgi:hypothetical protein
MKLYSEGECKQVLKEWALKLLVEVEKKTGEPIRQLPPTYEFEGKSEVPEFILELGNCVIYLVGLPVNLKLFNPAVVVCEKKRRKHRQGVGHSKVYYAIEPSGLPNFSAAVENAIKRDQEIMQVSGDEIVGFKELPPPDGVVAVPLKNGNIAVHVTTTELSPAKYTQLCYLMRNPL